MHRRVCKRESGKDRRSIGNNFDLASTEYLVQVGRNFFLDISNISIDILIFSVLLFLLFLYRSKGHIVRQRLAIRLDLG